MSEYINGILEQVEQEKVFNTLDDESSESSDGSESQSESEPNSDVNKKDNKIDNSGDASHNIVNNSTEGGKKSLFASEKVAELNSFLKKNPDKDISDYLSLKRSSEEIDANELLYSYYTDKGMTESEIKYKMSQMSLSDSESSDDDFDEGQGMSDTEQLRRRAEFDRELREAKAWRKKQVSDIFSKLEEDSVNESDYVSIADFQKQLADQVQRVKTNYVNGVYKLLPEMKSIDFSVMGETVSFVVDDDFFSEMRKVSENPDGTIFSSYKDADGHIVPNRDYIETLSWSNKATREKMISFIVEQAIARDRISRSNNKRNVTGDYERSSHESNTDEREFINWLNSKNPNNVS